MEAPLTFTLAYVRPRFAQHARPTLTRCSRRRHLVLGVTAFEMLTCERLFDSLTPDADELDGALGRQPLSWEEVGGFAG